MSSQRRRPRLAVVYEHPHWFEPLFRALERRGFRVARLRPEEAHFEIGRNGLEAPVVFNRMSPSAYLRGGAGGIFYTLHLLDHLERAGHRVVNGARAFRVETSKVLQLELLHRLGLPYPRTRVVHAAEAALPAAEELGFPVLVKPNLGGSGAGIRRFETPGALRDAIRAEEIASGIDGTLLVQEYVVPAEGRITRVEVLDGRVLYGIRVYLSGEGFNLCPADICRTTAGKGLQRDAVSQDTPDAGLEVEGYEPPSAVREEVLRVIDAAGMDLGGVEYVEDARTGRRFYYDVNALSNFVADATRVVGFDPTERLVDFLEEVTA